MEIMTETNLVLASGSPYRKQLLNKLNLLFICDKPNVDESPLPDELPSGHAIRLAQNKAQVFRKKYPEHLIIGSDQVAMHDHNQLTKPGNREKAIKQLQAVSGGCVEFYTAVCVFNSINGQYVSELDKCTVYFRELSRELIEKYIDADKPFDCAGSFKSESLGIALFERIEGEDPNALVGLPLIKLISILDKFNVEIP